MISHRRNNFLNRMKESCGVMLLPNMFWRNNLCRIALTFGILVAAGGCSKKAPSAAAPPPPDAPDQSVTASNQPASPQAVPAPVPGQQPAPTVQADGQPDLAALNRALVRWLVGNRRPPKNFEDFAATAGVTIPPPPPGKKFIITKDMHIHLVNQ
jgi:hypothetical protein